MFSIIWEEVGRPLELKGRKKTAEGVKTFDFMEEVLEPRRIVRTLLAPL